MATRLWRIIMVITVGAAPAQAQVMTWTSSRGPLTPAEAAAVLAPRATPPMWPVADVPTGPVVASTQWRPGDGPFGPFPKWDYVSRAGVISGGWWPAGPGPFGAPHLVPVGLAYNSGYYPRPLRHRRTHIVSAGDLKVSPGRSTRR